MSAISETTQVTDILFELVVVGYEVAYLIKYVSIILIEVFPLPLDNQLVRMVVQIKQETVSVPLKHLLTA
jgi:hypothetical protein